MGAVLLKQRTKGEVLVAAAAAGDDNDAAVFGRAEVAGRVRAQERSSKAERNNALLMLEVHHVAPLEGGGGKKREAQCPGRGARLM